MAEQMKIGNYIKGRIAQYKTPSLGPYVWGNTNMSFAAHPTYKCDTCLSECMHECVCVYVATTCTFN